MIKVEHLETYGWEAALRGMRNPMNSHEKADTVFDRYGIPLFGPNDLALMKRLYHAGTEHRKFLRQIGIAADITAPLYFWKEFDQYKVGVTTDSTSTMHKIHAKEFVMDDFSHEHLNDTALAWLAGTIDLLNDARETYLRSKSKDDWWQMIQVLPSSYSQRRTVTMNYEVVFNILRQRSEHKLDEWRNLCAALRLLPLVARLEEIGCG